MTVPELTLRTAAWYGDGELSLRWPTGWQVTIHRPRPAPPLSDEQIADRLHAALGQPLAERARGRRRPVIIVDDLNRPTPAARVIPVLLAQLAAAGIAAPSVTILMATGTHGPPQPDGFAKKVGRDAAARCRLAVHDCRGDLVAMGRTSFGTPILVNPLVHGSDLVLGVGGVYPNEASGFGGGAKLALGVLGFRSIASIHHRHASAGWGAADGAGTFRRDLDEIARIIGLRTSLLLLIDADRAVTDVACGDVDAVHATLVPVVRDRFRAPLPAPGTRVVVANTYPIDVSLTFARSKGLEPLRRAPAGASRIAVAACPEGLGFHGLFPFLNGSAGHRTRMLLLRLPMLLHQPGQLVEKVARRLVRELRGRRAGKATIPVRPTWVYRPPLSAGGVLPANVPGMQVTGSWDGILAAVQREQGGTRTLDTEIYACAPLQWVG